MPVFVSTMISRFNQRQATSAGGTLMMALVFITPLCGFLFHCGCTWPWAGLDSACNIHDSAASQRCPWCASLLEGLLSTSVAVLAGMIAAIVLGSRYGARKPFIDIALRIVAGLIVFAVAAILGAALSAKIQHYPIGLFATLI
ncbi:MAG: hypothetical protein ACU83N_13210 [Gammaproteobacteria bacterium]